MLTRLKVKGFKSLQDVEVRFGPLTCIVGPNNAGKSNLFDAIGFLARSADMPLREAAAGVRSGGHIASLLTTTASGVGETMEIEADFLVEPSLASTALRYRLCLRYLPAEAGKPEDLVVESESLVGVAEAELVQHLGFAASAAFLDSFSGRARVAQFLGMDSSDPGTLLVQRDDSPGKPERIRLKGAHRTFLSTCASVDHPTALAARREMQSWTVVHLEMGALRSPDDGQGGVRMSASGLHLPSALERLHQNEALAHRLAGLIPEVSDIVVDIDAHNQSKKFHVEMTGGTRTDAANLSDGALRLLALAVVSLDPGAGSLICIEEPENGIHPASARLIVELFADTVVDTGYPIGADNPLRQIIFNTHAPHVVQALGVDEILVARTYRSDGAALSLFSPMAESWRAQVAAGATVPVDFGALLDYLEPGDARGPGPDHKPNLLQALNKKLKLPSR